MGLHWTKTGAVRPSQRIAMRLESQQQAERLRQAEAAAAQAAETGISRVDQVSKWILTAQSAAHRIGMTFVHALAAITSKSPAAYLDAARMKQQLLHPVAALVVGAFVAALVAGVPTRPHVEQPLASAFTLESHFLVAAIGALLCGSVTAVACTIYLRLITKESFRSSWAWAVSVVLVTMVTLPIATLLSYAGLDLTLVEIIPIVGLVAAVGVWRHEARPSLRGKLAAAICAAPMVLMPFLFGLLMFFFVLGLREHAPTVQRAYEDWANPDEGRFRATGAHCVTSDDAGKSKVTCALATVLKGNQALAMARTPFVVRLSPAPSSKAGFLELGRMALGAGPKIELMSAMPGVQLQFPGVQTSRAFTLKGGELLLAELVLQQVPCAQIQSKPRVFEQERLLLTIEGAALSQRPSSVAERDIGVQATLTEEPKTNLGTWSVPASTMRPVYTSCAKGHP